MVMEEFYDMHVSQEIPGSPSELSTTFMEIVLLYSLSNKPGPEE